MKAATTSTTSSSTSQSLWSTLPAASLCRSASMPQAPCSRPSTMARFARHYLPEPRPPGRSKRGRLGLPPQLCRGAVHERRVREILARKRARGSAVTLSSEGLSRDPRIRADLDDGGQRRHVQPLIAGYLGRPGQGAIGTRLPLPGLPSRRPAAGSPRSGRPGDFPSAWWRAGPRVGPTWLLSSPPNAGEQGALLRQRRHPPQRSA